MSSVYEHVTTSRLRHADVNQHLHDTRLLEHQIEAKPPVFGYAVYRSTAAVP